MTIELKLAEVIESAAARLVRPESVAFSPSGDLKAVANSGNNSISIFQRIGSSGSAYELTPCCMLQDHRYLAYVHGVDFSPDGRFLAAVGRESHSLVIYPRSSRSGNQFSEEPSCLLSTSEYGLCFPADLAFHPSGRNLVVANRDGDTAVSFFNRAPGGEGVYGFNPARSIPKRTFTDRNMSSPHGLTYTPDGRQLLLCHSRFFKSEDQTGGVGISVLEFQDSNNRLSDTLQYTYHTDDLLVHSISIHPSGKWVGVTTCNGGAILFRHSESPCALEPCLTIPHQRKKAQEGPKGISFSRDGTTVEICNADHEINVYTFAIGQSR